MKTTFLAFMSLFLLVSCKNESMQIVESKNVGGVTNIGGGGGAGAIVGFDQAKLVFKAKCGFCHGAGVHPKDWTDYETAKANISKINDRLFVSGGMPASGSLSANEKALLKAWIAGGGQLVSQAGSGGGNTGGNGGGGTTDPKQPDTDTPIQSDDPVVRGEWIVQRKCLSCHGEGATAMKTPVLHGQFPKYIVAELTKFKNDQRKDLIMGAMPGVAKGLSDTDISDIAAYFEKQNPCSLPIQVDPGSGDVQRGKMKVDQNACLGCHRPKNTYGAPRLDGQKTEYVLHSLKIFRSKERTSAYMNPLTANFTDQDLLDLAAYMNSLRKCE